MELADQESAPKTADQFDRLVLANPNNSLLWINYIAFHLEVGSAQQYVIGLTLACLRSSI